MTLRKKTLLAIAVTLVGLTGVLYAVASKTLISNSIAAEEQDTRHTVQEAVNVLSQKQSTLHLRFKDWAWWDDAYAFIQDRNKNFALISASR